MKYIIAVIQPNKLEEVKRALEAVEVHLMTVSSVLGCGRQKGTTTVYRGTKEVGNLLKKIRIEIAVNEAFVQPSVDAITRAARTGDIGDGKIFILDLHECVRIRTGETGGVAIG